ncbi:unnamed protein product [Amoebophrya sp. A120]|nr:unnamed protein product [Amoebophrya sp. A120]|eukprot:GSA120T00000108001.1
MSDSDVPLAQSNMLSSTGATTIFNGAPGVVPAQEETNAGGGGMTVNDNLNLPPQNKNKRKVYAYPPSSIGTETDLEQDQHAQLHQLKRALSLPDLVLFGLGCTIGSGIFLLSGPAVLAAGPAVLISFTLTAFAVLMSAFCYVEASAYTGQELGVAYGFVLRQFGEQTAFMLASALILEMMVGFSVSAKGFANYFRSVVLPIVEDGNGKDTAGAALLRVHDIDLGISLTSGSSKNKASNTVGHGPEKPEALVSFDFVAIVFWAIVTATVTFGIDMSKIVNHTGMFAKGGALCLFIAFSIYVGFGSLPEKVGVWSEEPGKYFAPTGLGGILEGAGIIVFAFIGFESLAQLAEETKGDPKRTLPAAMVLTVAGSFAVYFSVALGILSLTDAKAFADLDSVSSSGGGGEALLFLQEKASSVVHQRTGVLAQELQLDGTTSAGDSTSLPFFSTSAGSNSPSTSLLLRRDGVATASTFLASFLSAMTYSDATTTSTSFRRDVTKLEDPTPLAALTRNKAPVVSDLISIGACLGIFPLAVNYLLSSSRMLLRIAREGYLPAWCAEVNAKTHTPVGTTLLQAGFSAVLTLFPYRFLAEVNSVGTLIAFTLVCLAVLASRKPPSSLHLKMAGRNHEDGEYNKYPVAGKGEDEPLVQQPEGGAKTQQHDARPLTKITSEAVAAGAATREGSTTRTRVTGTTEDRVGAALESDPLAHTNENQQAADDVETDVETHTHYFYGIFGFAVLSLLVSVSIEAELPVWQPAMLIVFLLGIGTHVAMSSVWELENDNIKHVVPGMPLIALFGMFFNLLMLAQLRRGFGVSFAWLTLAFLWYYFHGKVLPPVEG